MSVSSSDPSKPCTVYWKVLNEMNIHHGFLWKTGLNVLKGHFNNDEFKECVPGRLYYCTQEQIHNWLYFGDHIQRIYEPTDDPLFQSVSFGDKKGANRLILDSQVWSLSDPKTFEMLGLQVIDFPHLFEKAYQSENIKFLDVWVVEYMKDTGVKFECSDELMCDAFERGHINILNWWLEQKQKHDINLYVCSHAVAQASANGHHAVLDWWMEQCQKGHLCPHNSPGSLKHTSSYASYYGRIDVLNWWLKEIKKKGTISELEYHDAMDFASLNGRIDVLDWWMERYQNKDIPQLIYSDFSMVWADVKGHSKVLDWWLDQHKKHGIPLKYCSKLTNAWWKQNAAQIPLPVA